MPNNLLTTKFEILIGNTWEDYTDGLLNANIIRGVQSAYQGPWQQSESGVMTIVSRNEQLDPHINTDFRLGKTVRVSHDDVTLFTGRINTINVDYQPKGEPSITTLTAVDMLGTMALHTLRDTFKDRLGSTMSMTGFNQELELTGNPGNDPTQSEIIGYSGTVHSTSGYGDATNAPDGISALEMFTKLAQTNLDFFYADKNNEVNIYNNVGAKKNQSVKLQFDSRGGATSYSTINLTDGFDLLKNKIVIDNGQGVTIPTYTNSYSIEEWGSQSATIRTYFTTPGQSSYTDELAADIFEETAHPTREIDTITFDATHAPDTIEDIEILDNVYVYHEVDGFDIDRKYGIIGISHNITRDSWDITYKLRNMFTYETVFPTPIVTSTPLSGTTADTFTFSITNLADIDTTSATYVWKDNGSTFSTAQSPTKTYTLAQVGSHNITCTVTDSYGFVKTSAAYVLNVYGTAPTGVSFTYAINPNDSAAYTFTGTATNATSYKWDFGNGYVNGANIISYRFTTSGSKTVNFKAINAYGETVSTQTISVTVPPIPADQTGTWGVRYVRFGMDSFNASDYYWPGMTNFTAKTSSTLTNRASENQLVATQAYQVYPTELWGYTAWKKADGTALPSTQDPTTMRSGGFGLKPYNEISGNANWGIVVDLQQTYFDIKTFGLTFQGTAASNAPTFVNVYITDYVGSSDTIAQGASVTWTKVGTINRSTGVFTPVTTMPANLELNTSFMWTIGNSSDNIKNDKYSFTTNNYLTSAYLWDFGDGTTSTEQNPVHVYTSNGTKTVSLTKYDEYGNSATGTQTLTVNRLVDQLGTFPVRYIKLKQNAFTSTGTTEAQTYFSPAIGAFSATTSATGNNRLFNKNCTVYTQLPSSVSISWKDWDNIDGASVTPTAASPFLGTFAPDEGGSYEIYPRNAISMGDLNYNGVSAVGLIPKRTTIAGTGTTEWEMVWDLGTARYDLKTLGLRLNRKTLLNLTATSSKPSYEIYFSSNGTTWTKVANVTAPTMTNTNQWYAANISTTATLPLNI